MKILLLLCLLMIFPIYDAYACSITDAEGCVRDIINPIIDKINSTINSMEETIKDLGSKLSKVETQINDFDVNLISTVDAAVSDEIDTLGSTIASEFKTIIKPIENEVKTITKDIKRIEHAVVNGTVGTLHKILNDMNHMKNKANKLEKLVEKDIVAGVHEIKKDVKIMEQTTKKIEKAVSQELIKDVGILKIDVNIVKDETIKLGKSVIKIEKKVVSFTEHFIEALVKDVMSVFHKIVAEFWYVSYVIIALIVGVIGIKIFTFSLWVKGIFRQTSIEHMARKQVDQNEKIIKLLEQMVNN